MVGEDNTEMGQGGAGLSVMTLVLEVLSLMMCL